MACRGVEVAVAAVDEEKEKIFPVRYPSDPCCDFLGEVMTRVSVGVVKLEEALLGAVGECGELESST